MPEKKLDLLKLAIKFLARDDDTGRIGTFQTSFVIPDLNKAAKRVPISSVVLSSQRFNLNDALYNATRGKEQARDDVANPLVADGQKLIPSVTRVFNIDRNLFVYLQAYRGSSTAASETSAPNTDTPFFAFVTLYRNQKLTFETAPIAVMPQAGSRLGIVPISFSVGLGKLAPGEYQCQVSVLDPAGHRAAFWRGPIMLVR